MDNRRTTSGTGVLARITSLATTGIFVAVAAMVNLPATPAYAGHQTTYLCPLGHDETDGFCLSGRRARNPLYYRVNPNTADLTNEVTLVNNADNTWEGDAGSDITVAYQGTTSIASPMNDGTNAAFWTNDTSLCGAGVPACAALWPDPNDSSRWAFDMIFNDLNYQWCDCPGGYDVQAAALHEFGHALGLNHVLSHEHVMGANWRRQLGRGDLNGVRNLFPSACNCARDFKLRTSASGWHAHGRGALTPFGSDADTAPPLSGAPSFGSDLVREFALLNSSQGYLLEGFGGIHSLGGAPGLSGGPYFGFDISRSLVVTGSGGGYLLDGYGAVHKLGNAPALGGIGGISPPYWGWDIGRRLILQSYISSPTPAAAGYILDGFGAIHKWKTSATIADPPTITGAPYFSGFDIARDLTFRDLTLGQGYLLDGYGAIHRLNNAPAITSYTMAVGTQDIARAIERWYDFTCNCYGGYVLTRTGRLWKFTT